MNPLAAVRPRSPSPAALRATTEHRSPSAAAARSEASIRRRLGWVWGLLFVNILAYTVKSPVLHLPVTMGKVITQGALVAAVVLALSINRRVLVRPNLFLFLLTVLCITSVMMSVRGYFGLGSALRAGRLVLLIATLWLITPWWGRRDLLLFQYHRRALYVILAVVLIGIPFSPHEAFAQAGGGRLGGTIWPIPPTQVADYAAILGGTTIILWFTGLIKPRVALGVTLGSTVVLLLTHTRTALVALLVAVLVAALSLVISRKRVRTVLVVVVVAGGLIALSAAPFLTAWFTRGESAHELASFTGRTTVWAQLAAQPRSELHALFGYGMSNDSFHGLSIDSSWYSAYLDQGLFGDVIDAATLLLLGVLAVLSPRGPRRALALFLVVYCLLASITETGLGQASSYLLDLAIAMSLLMTPLGEPSGRHPVATSGPPHQGRAALPPSRTT